MSVHPFIHLSICLSIQMLIHPSIDLFDFPSSIWPSIRLSVEQPSTHPSLLVVHWYTPLIFHPFIHPCLHQNKHSSIHPFIRTSIDPTICSFIQPSNQNNFNFQKCFGALNVRWHYNKAVLILDRWLWSFVIREMEDEMWKERDQTQATQMNM